MAAVSQVVPNYVQGISNQPDELKLPGQVRDLKNAWPDVTRGCMKRLGSKKIKMLGTGPEGKWFTIERGRGPAEQFLGKISYYEDEERPEVRIWNMDGREVDVTYTQTPLDDPKIVAEETSFPPPGAQYLVPGLNPNYNSEQQRAEERKYIQLKIAQGDGKTFVLNPTVKPDYVIDDEETSSQIRSKDDSSSVVNHYYESFISLRQVQYQRDYLLAFDDPNKFDTEDNIEYTYATSFGDVAWRRDPNDRKFDDDEITEVTDLQMGFNRTFLSANEIEDPATAIGKIILLESSNPDGVDLNLSLEVIGRAIQKIDRHIKNPAKDDYYWVSEYLPRAQLLKGGKNWKAGDKITIGYKPDEADISKEWDKFLIAGGYVPLVLTIGDEGVSTIMADIGYISVRTDQNETDATIPFASANDIILGLCYALEQAGAKPIIMDDNGEEVVADKEIYSEEPSTVTVNWGGSGDENVTEDVGGPDNDRQDFLRGLNIEFKPIGNGIYMRKASDNDDDQSLPFKLVTPEEQLFNSISTKGKGEWYLPIAAVSRLPNQCRHNLRVLVRNTENNSDDDYFLKFVGNDDTDGEGSWEECVKPGYRVRPKSTTMPWEIVYVGDHFIVTPIYWQAREVGDENTAPAPSFLPATIKPKEKEFKLQKRITGMSWYRNRFLLFSDKNIIASRDGDYYNFWPKTARTVTDEDPIDIAAAAQQPSPIVDALEMTAGLVLFGKDEQFLMTTDADSFRPATAKVMAISRYNMNVDVHPVKMGQNIAFLSDAGLNDKMFEMSQVAREGSEPQVVELSKLVEPLLPDNVNLMTASKSNMSVFIAKYWTPDYLFAEQNTTIDGEEEKFRLFNNEKFREVWGYRYFDNGQRRVQAAWFRWTFDMPVCYHATIDDNYFYVVYNHLGETELRKIGLKFEDEIRDVYLDGYYSGCPNGCLVDGNTLIWLDGFYREGECIYAELYDKNELIDAYRCDPGFEPCKKGYGTVQFASDETGYPCRPYIYLEGDWTAGCDGEEINCTDVTNKWRITIGKPYSMVVDFPTIYVGKQQGESYRARWDPNLMLHRAKFSVGHSKYDTATYKIEVKRKSRDTVERWYDVEFPYPYLTEQVFTHPIYMRNTDIDMRLICDDPHGGKLHSMVWEGDYNPKWYKYV